MNHKQLLSAAAALALAAGPALAQSTIDHNKALAGNVTAGDAPGYPITISAPGSYKLGGNLQVPAGQHGIVISAPGVTLDLNGYAISGPAVCTGDVSWTVSCQVGVTTYGVASDAFMTVVRNGLVEGFGTGVLLGGSGVRGNYRVEDIVAVRNTGFGISLLSGTVARSQASWNGSTGFQVQEGSLIDSAAAHNKYYGFSLRRSLVTGSRTHGSPTATYVHDTRVGFVSSYLDGTALTSGGNLVSMGNNYCNGSPC